MAHTSHLENKFGTAASGYIQKSRKMEMLFSAAIKSFMGNVIAFMFWAGWAATGIDWFRTLGYISLFLTIGYNSYKWGKELRADFKSGKKRMPFKRKK